MLEVNRYKSLRISFTLAVLTFSKMFIASNQMDASVTLSRSISTESLTKSYVLERGKEKVQRRRREIGQDEGYKKKLLV